MVDRDWVGRMSADAMDSLLHIIAGRTLMVVRLSAGRAVIE